MKKGLLNFIFAAGVTVLYDVNVFAAGNQTKGVLSFSWWKLLIIFVLFLGLYLLNVQRTYQKINNKAAATSAELERISKTDSSWNEEELRRYVENVFNRVQRALNNRNLDVLEEELHPSLFEDWKSQILRYSESDASLGQPDAKVELVKIVDVQNYKDNEKDAFTASVDISEYDYTVNGKGELITYEGSANEERPMNYLTEYWTFERENDKWMLRRVGLKGRAIDSKIINEDSVQTFEQ